MAALDSDDVLHAPCNRLLEAVQKKNIPMHMPMHTAFEARSVLQKKQLDSKKNHINSPYNENVISPRMILISIDGDFVEKYAAVPIPHIKGSDSIFLALSTKDQCFLLQKIGSSISFLKH